MDIENEREYYPIDEAAKILGCSTSCLINLASTGKINVWVLLNHKHVVASICYFDTESEMDEHGQEYGLDIVFCEKFVSISYSGLASLHGFTVKDLELKYHVDKENAKIEITDIYKLQNIHSDITKAIDGCPPDLSCSDSYKLHSKISVGVANIYITKHIFDSLNDSNIRHAKSIPEPSKHTTNPWDIPHPSDPPAKLYWYTPARYFARELVVKDSTLLKKRDKLAQQVVKSLTGVGIFKRGGEKAHDPNTVLKAFVKVNLG